MKIRYGKKSLFASLLLLGVSVAVGEDGTIADFRVTDDGVKITMGRPETAGRLRAAAPTWNRYEVMGKVELTDAAWVRLAEKVGTEGIDNFLVNNVKDGKEYHFFKVIVTELPPPPVVMNADATYITWYSAQLNATLVTGAPATTTLYWGTRYDVWQNEIIVGAIYDNGVFSWGVSGLLPSTTYYFTSYATNATGEAWAPMAGSFTTLPRPIDRVTRTYFFNTMMDPTGFTNPSDVLRGAMTSTVGWIDEIETDGTYAYCTGPSRNATYSIVIARYGLGNDVPEYATVVSTALYVRLARDRSDDNKFMLHMAGNVEGRGWQDWSLLSFNDKQDGLIPSNDSWVTLRYDLPTFERGGAAHLQIGARRTNVFSTRLRVAWAKLVVEYNVPRY